MATIKIAIDFWNILKIYLFNMQLFLATFLPCLYFFYNRLWIQGILCLGLQVCVVGWAPAALWAVAYLFEEKLEDKHQELLQEVRGRQPIC